MVPPVELGLLLPPLGALEDEELLQAAAARHKASDADATTAPFLAILIIKTTSRLKEGPSGHIQACGDKAPRPGDVAALRLKHDHRTLEINVALTSAAGREDSVNELLRASYAVTLVTGIGTLVPG